jgi:enamine deaminase RidA (YjgF/YER057c/UK114 family)
MATKHPIAAARPLGHDPDRRAARSVAASPRLVAALLRRRHRCHGTASFASRADSDTAPVNRTLIHTPGLYAGVPYSYAAIASSGSTVFTAGACPIDSEGRVVAPDDVASQTRRALDNLLSALRSAGCGLEDVVKTTVYVAATERADLVAAWNEVERRFGSGGPPSTLLGVSVLGFSDQLVEIEAVAAPG